MTLTKKMLAGSLGPLAVLAASLCASGAHAQLPPPSPIFDLATVHPTPLGNYTNFSVNFVAGVANTTVSFAFREVPAFFAFDNASVSTGGGANLLVDPGFESSAVGSNFPAGWTRFIQPIDVSAIGQIASNASPYGCNVGASQGTQYWCDGSVEGYDGLAQTLNTVVGQTYTVNFDLEDDSGAPITYPTIDFLVYAGDSLPGGTMMVGAPEPASYAILIVGLLGLTFGLRRFSRKI